MVAWFSPSGSPADNSAGSSATIRAEFTAIQTAIDKLPTGPADGILKINAGNTAIEAVASLPVASGGTGASTLTDGAVLLGSGTGAITPMARLADSEMIVGQAAGDPVVESGATLRTSIGLGTGDAASFDSLVLATALPVGQGGIGVATLTASGVLLGQGTSAVTALAAMADGEFIVGDGVGDPVLESGNTARTSLSLGTGDSPTFAGLTLTAALTVAQGGTGVATLGDGFVLLGSGTGAITALDVTAKGSILVGDGTTDPVALAVTTDDFVLTADAATASGLKWAAIPASGGTLNTIKEAGVQLGGADIVTLDFDGDDFNLTETPDTEVNITIPDASLTVLGLIELGTQAEVDAGSSSILAVAPSTLAGWAGSANIVTVGTIATGVWSGDTLNVNVGGTGATILTTGGVLLGSGTGAVTAMTRLTLNQFLVGQTSGDPVAQSPSTVRTTLGVHTTHTGDVTGDAALTIAANAVTYDKMQAVANDERLLGNIAGASQPVVELTVAQVRTMLGSVTIGAGLSGGVPVGTGTLAVDISGLTAMTVAPIGTDGYLIDDGGTMKRVAINDQRMVLTTDSGIHTWTDADMNEARHYTGSTSTDAWTMNTSIGEAGKFVMIVNNGGSDGPTVTAGTATVDSSSGNFVVKQDGIAILYSHLANNWKLSGDLVA